MKKLKRIKNHHLNALHIYCRLIDYGFNKKSAKKIAMFLTFRIIGGKK